MRRILSSCFAIIAAAALLDANPALAQMQGGPGGMIKVIRIEFPASAQAIDHGQALFEAFAHRDGDCKVKGDDG